MRHVILVLSSHSQREQRNSLLSLRRQLRHVIHTLRNSLNYTERTNSLVTVYILSHRAFALWDFCFFSCDYTIFRGKVKSKCEKN